MEETERNAALDEECCHGEGRNHTHGGECECGHDHDRAHAHAHAMKQIPAEQVDIDEHGLGWEGICPCGCGGSGHHEEASAGSNASAEGAAATGAAGAAADATFAGTDTADSAEALFWLDEYLDVPDLSDAFIDDDEEDFAEPVEPSTPDLAESDFTFQGVRYHVRRWSVPGDIPLVALHGFMQSGATWEQVAPGLAMDYCVYALDLVGHGASDKPRDPAAYTLAAQSEAVAAFIEQIVLPENVAASPERPVTHAHLLGYSLGGRIALETALSHSDLVYTLVLESAGLGPKDEDDRAAYAQRAADQAALLRNQGMEAFVDMWEQLPLFASQTRLVPEVGERVRAERLANDAEALALTLENAGQHTMALERETRDRMSYCWTPVLYICGTLDDKYLAQAEDLTRMGLDAKPLMGGHNLHLEVPGYFLKALEAFFSNNEVRGC